MEVKLVRFVGVEPVDIVASQLIQDDVGQLIERAMAFLLDQTKKQLVVTSKLRREEIYEYPSKVLREAIVNAVVHRDYFSRDAIQIYLFADRIEITNPGGLPRGLSEELFGTLSVHRNPIIYRFLRDFGYVEGLGTGIPRMKNELRKVGMADPEFRFTDAFFRVVIFSRTGRRKPVETEGDLSVRQQKALDYLKKNPSLKTEMYMTLNGVSRGTTLHDIHELIHYGYLKQVGKYRGVYYALKSSSPSSR